MKKESISLAFICLLTTICGVSGCQNAKTYKDIIVHDVYERFPDVFEKYGLKEKDIKITRSYILINGCFTFNIPMEQRFGWAPIYSVVKYQDEEIHFKYDQDVPYVWRNHEIMYLNNFLYRYNDYSLEDFLKIKEMYENNQNDFDLLNVKYQE